MHLGTRTINHKNERNEKMESSGSDEDSGIIKDKPLNKLQMQKEECDSSLCKQESFD